MNVQLCTLSCYVYLKVAKLHVLCHRPGSCLAPSAAPERKYTYMAIRTAAQTDAWYQ